MTLPRNGITLLINGIALRSDVRLVGRRHLMMPASVLLGRWSKKVPAASRGTLRIAPDK